MLNRHLYENNYLPITGYDETARIQFVYRLMYAETKRLKPHTKKMDSETYFSSDRDYNEFACDIIISCSRFKLNPFSTAEIQAKNTLLALVRGVARDSRGSMDKER